MAIVLGNTISANLFDYTQQNSIVASRVLGTTYQNTTGRAMLVAVETLNTSPDYSSTSAFTDSVNPPVTQIASFFLQTATIQARSTLTFIVLPGNFYRVTAATGGAATITLETWVEWS